MGLKVSLNKNQTNEHIFFNGAKFFNQKGFDAFRFDLYSAEKGGRHFTNTSISMHGADTNLVVNYFKKQYKKIYLVGHSYGGTTLLFVDTTNVSAMVFWDASYVDSKRETNYFKYNKHIDGYIVKDRYDYIVGNKFIDELKNFPDCGNLVSKIHIPVKFITAGGRGNPKGGKKYLAKANKPKELANIKNADHCFDRFEYEQKLLEETLNFIRKY